MKHWRAILAIAGGFGAVMALVGAVWVQSLGPAPLGKNLEYSHVVLDREGRLLRAYATTEGRWRLSVSERDVDPRFFKLLFTYEDKRFHDHLGVDPLSLGRAAVQLISRGQIISGGSTISMQVARLLEPRERRSLGAKMRQIVRALELERALGKDGILALYLALAPYGGNLEGVRAASLAYFGKEPRKLSLAEAALLVALPQSPELRRPDRFPTAARAARDRVLDRVAIAGLMPRDEIARAKSQPVPHDRKPLPVLAPHAADQVVLMEPDRREHRLTLDLFLQKNLQELARERAQALGPDISVAILAVDNVTGEVRVRVASADYFDLRRAGQVDMTQALRSPGSTLKPFIYGLGFEDGVIHPDTLIDDRPSPLRQLHAGKFRSDLPGRGHGPSRAAIVAQRSSGRGSQQDWRKSPGRAVVTGRCGAGLAERRSARPRYGAWRGGHPPDRPGHALCQPGPTGRGARLERASRGRRTDAAPTAWPRGRLVRRQYSLGGAAAR